MRRWPARLVNLWVALMLAALPQPAGAGDWYFVPQIDAGAKYDSNINFSFSRIKSDFIFNGSPALDLKYDSESTNLSGRLNLEGLAYVKNPNLDAINQYYRLAAKHQAAPRLALTISGGYTLDTTLTEELQASGYIMNRTLRQAMQVAPGLEFALSERALLRWGYGFDLVTYQDPRYNDYSTHRVTLELNYLLKNAKTTLTATVLGRYTEYPSIGNFYRNIGVYGGLEHKFSEDWSLALSGGANFNRFTSRTRVLDFTFFPDFILTKQVPEETFTVSPYFNIAATRRWPRTDLTFGYSVDQSPSASGSLSQFHRGYAGISHKLTEKLSGGLRGSLYYSTYTSPGSDYENLVFYLTPDLRYNLTEKFSLKCSYQFGWREDPVRDRTTDRQVIWLSLSFAYPLGYKKMGLE
ncbi:MAG: hypothetical protein ACUVXF_08020 [Desulfobaccales bacterium]